MANKAEQLIDALEPLAQEHGLDLVTVEVAGTRKNPILRVFLDTPEGGITLDALADAQEWVDAKVEQLDPFEDAYTLEVSSPGIDRPLRKRADFDRFAGEDCVVYLKKGEARTKVTGVLNGMEGDEVIVVCEDGERVAIGLNRVKKANIIGRIDFSGLGSLGDAESTTE